MEKIILLILAIILFHAGSYTMESEIRAYPNNFFATVAIADNKKATIALPLGILALRPTCLITHSCPVLKDEKVSNVIDTDFIIVDLTSGAETFLLQDEVSGQNLATLNNIATNVIDIWSFDVPSLPQLRCLCLAADKLDFEDPEKLTNQLFMRYRQLTRDNNLPLDPDIHHLMSLKNFSIATVFNAQQLVPVFDKPLCYHHFLPNGLTISEATGKKEECLCDLEAVEELITSFTIHQARWTTLIQEKRNFKTFNLSNLGISSVYGLAHFLQILSNTKQLYYTDHSGTPEFKRFRPAVEQFLSSSDYHSKEKLDNLIKKAASWVSDIDLSYNNLEIVDFNEFPLQGKHKPISINVSHNKIQIIKPTEIRNELILYTVDLSHNQLADKNILTTIATTCRTSIRPLKINLSHNKFTQLELPPPQTYILDIDACDNPLTKITLPEKFVPEKYKIKLSDAVLSARNKSYLIKIFHPFENNLIFISNSEYNNPQ
jgi:hypothetical protein